MLLTTGLRSTTHKSSRTSTSKVKMPTRFRPRKSNGIGAMMTLKHVAIIMTLSTLTLAMMACGGDPQREDTSPSHSGTASSVPRVSDVFGAAEWSIETTENHSVLDVQPNRLFTREAKTLSAYSSTGEKVWQYELPTSHISIETKNGIVVIIWKTTAEDTTQNKKKSILKMTILSQEDGTVKEERELKELTDTDKDLTGATRFGNTTFQLDQTLNTIDSDGNIATINMKEYKIPEYQNIHVIGRTPFWTPAASQDSLTSPNWALKEFPGATENEIFSIRPMAIDREFDLIIVQVDKKEGPNLYFAVKATTGEIAYQITCPSEPPASPSQTRVNGGPEAVAKHSPNGKYSVWGAMRLTSTEGRCVGGGDQGSVWFTAVDDNGTAYGDAEPTRQTPEEIVIAPANGQPRVTEASVPIGIMNNNLAIHATAHNGETKGETITGNPIT